jgi:hypothetical protein
MQDELEYKAIANLACRWAEGLLADLRRMRQPQTLLGPAASPNTFPEPASVSSDQAEPQLLAPVKSNDVSVCRVPIDER